MSQLIGMHEAYRIARNSGYIKDQAVSYATMAVIVADAYKKGYEKAEADKKAVLFMVKGAQTIAQYKIMRWIDEHFTDVEIKPQKADIVKITDSVGGCMIITINATGDVINALSGEILDREGAMV